jgi:hypothetical protein
MMQFQSFYKYFAPAGMRQHHVILDIIFILILISDLLTKSWNHSCSKIGIDQSSSLTAFASCFASDKNNIHKNNQ